MQTGDINDALIDACEAGCIEKVTVLLDLGADVNYQDEVILMTNSRSTLQGVCNAHNSSTNISFQMSHHNHPCTWV